MHQGRRPPTYTLHKNLTKEQWNRGGFLLNIKNKAILKINLNTHSKHKHQAGAWRIKQKEGMKSEFNQFNFNTKVGWIAPNGINNGEDHTGLVDLTLKIISTRINHTAQESTEWGIPLTSDISWGSVPLTEQAVGVDLPPASQPWSPQGANRMFLWCTGLSNSSLLRECQPSASSTPTGSSHTQGKHQSTTRPCVLTWQGEPTGAAFLLLLHGLGQCQNWSQCFLPHTWGQAGKKSDQLIYTCSHSFITLGVGRLKECKWLLFVWFFLPTTLNKKKTQTKPKQKKT